ncbi:ATP-binding protein [Alteromonas flava]|uniref:ATP-binding protein n=1 Tax=Alteromonas flava TaxID=2048003 RepID=UPI0013DCF55C|nr:ATP-binding protein [Alteromonas flava]
MAIFLFGILGYSIASPLVQTYEEVDKSDIGLIHKIFDGGHRIWLGSENGLFFYSKGAYFQIISFPQTAPVTAILATTDYLFIGTSGNGMYIALLDPSQELIFTKLDSENLNFIYDLAFSGEFGVLVSAFDSVNKISVLTNGDYLIEPIASTVNAFTILENDKDLYYQNGNSLIRLDLSNDTYTKLELSPQLGETFVINKIKLLNDDELFLGTSRGLVKVKLTGSEFGAVRTALENQNVTEIQNFGTGQNIVYSEKIYLIDEHLNIVKSVNMFENFVSDKEFSYVHQLFKKNGKIAMASPLSGFFWLPLGFSSINKAKFNGKKLRIENVSEFMELLILYDGHELFIHDRLTFEINPFSEYLEIGEVDQFIVNGSDDLVTASSNIIRVFDSSIKLIDSYELDSSIVSLKDFSGDTIALTENGKLYRLVNKGISEIHLNFSPNEIFVTSDSLFALDYYQGLYSTNTYETWHTYDVSNLTEDIPIDCVEKSPTGTIYFCTSGFGIQVLSNESSTLVNSKLNDLIHSRYIRDIAIDLQGNLWVATNAGLYRVSANAEWKQKINTRIGIKDGDFEFEGLRYSRDDQLVVTGDDDSYILNMSQLIPVLNELLVSSNPVYVDDITIYSGKGEYPALREKIPKTTKGNFVAEIKSDVYQFDVHFAAVDPIDHNYLDFEYRLIGLSENWQLAKRGTSTASYSALPFGDYEFQVRAVDYQSKEQQPITSQKIRVLPPIWLTQAAFLIYFLLAVLLYFLFLILAKKAKKRQLKFAEDYAEERTMALHEKLTNLKEALVKEKTIFSSLSAELRTPLTYLQGWLTKSIQSNKPDVIKDSINSSLNTVQRVNCLIEQFDEIENLVGNERLFEVTVEVRSSINSLVESFEQIAKLRGIRISIKGGKGLYIRTHKSSFERIFSNLIGNAIKYTLPNTEVTLSIKKKVEKVVISIIDQGEGIQESELHQIFERFSKLDNNSQLEGSGLGLAVVKEQLEANNGEIRVESSIGVGTEFHVIFKLTEPPKSANEKADMDPNKIAILDKSSLTLDGSHDELKSSLVTMADKATVLIADSSVHIRNYLADMFEPTYHCIRSVNGKEALDIALTVMPNVIIADIDLPLLNGLKLTTKIRENEQTSTIPIIIISANSDRSTKINALSSKADDFILKPFEAAEIKFKVEQIIKMRPKLDAQLDKSELAKPETVIDLEHIVMPEFDEEKDQRFYMQLVVLLQQNYQDPNFNKDFAATSMNCTERQINRKLNDFLGLSFTSFVKQYRLKKAAKKLLNSSNISEVAFDLGFGSPSYFGMCFRDYYEMTPSQFIACGGNVSLVKNKSKKGTKVAKSN